MAYFECIYGGGSSKGNTLIITCDPDFAGQTITCAKTGKSYTKTCSSTSPYTVEFNGVEPGTYTISCTLDGDTYSNEVTVTNIENVLLRGFNWRAWVNATQNYSSEDYEDLDEVLEDEKLIRELMTIHACVDILASVTVADEFIEKIIKNDLCAKWINLNDYALDKLLANEAIKDVMDRSNSQLVAGVPTMTSNTTPSGVASTSSQYSADRTAYKAFDGDSTTSWLPALNASNADIGYQFTNLVCIKKIQFLPTSEVDATIHFSVWASLNGTDYVELTCDINDFVANANELVIVNLDNSTSYLYAKVVFEDCLYPIVGSQSQGCNIRNMQFFYEKVDTKYGYGEWTLMPQVPKMTSNTAPYGTVLYDSSKTSGGSSGSDYYKLFSGTPQTVGIATNITSQYFGYDFTKPITLSRIAVMGNYDSGTMTLVVEGSDDNSTWSSVSESISYDSSTDFQYFHFTPTTYRYWRINATKGTSSSVAFKQLQFYAYAPKGNVPVMTSDTAPYGQASASGYATNSEAFKAFDGVNNVVWQANSSSAWIKYKFTNPICVKAYRAVQLSAATRTLSLTLQGSNDDSTWENIENSSASLTPSNYNVVTNVTNDKYYLYYRVNCSSSDSRCALEWLQFYGRELSVSVPTMAGYTNPYGDVIYTGTTSDYAWRAFNNDNGSSGNYTGAQKINGQIGYRFTSNVKVCMAVLKTHAQYYHTKLQVKASNDGVTYTSCSEEVNNTPDTYITIPVSSENACKYWVVYGSNANTTSGAYMRRLQFYGKDYSEKEFETGATKEWIYDHGIVFKPLEALGGGSYTIGPCSIIMSAPSNQIEQVGHRCDLTDYSYARFKMGSNYIHNSSNFFGIGATLDDNSGTYGYVRLTDNIPYNLAVDISADNLTAYVKFYCGYNAKIEYTEMWLE